MANGKHRRGIALAAFVALAALSKPAFAQAEAKGLPGPTEEQLATLQAIYEDLHANPELSMQEKRTAGIAAKWLREQGFEVTEGVGGTGVVGLLRNGDGPTVLLRADMDGLPMKENTGLPTYDDAVRDKVLALIKRVVEGEAAISGAPKPPLLTMLGQFPLTVNDEDATAKVAEALKRRLGAERIEPAASANASEDFTVFARAWDVPSVFWFVGGTDPKVYAEAERAGTLNALPSNHSPEYAPVLTPTLRTGVETMLAAAGP